MAQEKPATPPGDPDKVKAEIEAQAKKKAEEAVARQRERDRIAKAALEVFGLPDWKFIHQGLGLLKDTYEADAKRFDKRGDIKLLNQVNATQTAIGSCRMKVSGIVGALDKRTKEQENVTKQKKMTKQRTKKKVPKSGSAAR